MAPSTTSALNPIVIPPSPVHPHFTTLGSGLLHGTHARESVHTLRNLLFGPRPLANNDKPKTWWRAQCLLYGLHAPEKQTVEQLRTALEYAILTGVLQVPASIVELEKLENGKFRKLNAQVREGASGAKGKKAATPKDPLKTVKSAGKVTKSQPMKRNATAAISSHNSVGNINVTIHMPAAPAAAKPKAAKPKAAKPKAAPAKKTQAKAVPKPRRK